MQVISKSKCFIGLAPGLSQETKLTNGNITHLDSLAVHVGQLLNLEGSLQARGEVVAAAHDQQGLLVVQLVGNLQHLGVLSKDFLDLKPEDINN